jgi:hypothetical protein
MDRCIIITLTERATLVVDRRKSISSPLGGLVDQREV